MNLKGDSVMLYEEQLKDICAHLAMKLIFEHENLRVRKNGGFMIVLSDEEIDRRMGELMNSLDLIADNKLILNHKKGGENYV